MKTPKVVELALNQVDTIGFELQKRGITQKVNRHTIVANALMAKDRVLGEKRRLDLVLARHKYRLEKPIQLIEKTWHSTRGYVPSPVRKRIDRIID